MAQLIVFLPLIGFLFCFFFGKKFNFQSITNNNNIVAIYISNSILDFIFSYIGERETQIIHIFNWFTSGNFIVDWSIRLDSLTTTMFIVVCSVSACVHLYSIGYMSDDPIKREIYGILKSFHFLYVDVSL